MHTQCGCTKGKGIGVIARTGKIGRGDGYVIALNLIGARQQMTADFHTIAQCYPRVRARGHDTF